MFYVTATVNTPNREWEYKITHENDLSALMRRIKETHPNCTSVVLTVLWNDNVVNQI